MKKVLLIILICMVFIGLTGIYVVSGIISPEWWLEKFATRIENLDDKYTNDLEIQMGLLFLYDPHLLSCGERTKKDKYERILALDPNNRVAWTVKVKHVCWRHTGGRRSRIKRLNTLKKFAIQQNLEELNISKYSDVHPWFKEQGIDSIPIKDWDTTVEQMLREYDKQFPNVLAVIDKGQSIDPDNALYNYLKAHSYLVLNESEKAVEEIEKGVAKKYLSTYQNQMSKAAAKVLKKVCFPMLHRKFVLGSHNPFIANIGSTAIKGLRKLAEDYEMQGDFKSAEKMYNLLLAIAEQVKHEPAPSNWAAEQNLQDCQSLQIKTEKRLGELRKKMLKEKK